MGPLMMMVGVRSIFTMSIAIKSVLSPEDRVDGDAISARIVIRDAAREDRGCGRLGVERKLPEDKASIAGAM